MDKKKIRAWIGFDWASQPFHTVIVTFVFAPYFVSEIIGDEVQGQSLVAMMATISALMVAVAAPISTAYAEYGGGRKKWIFALSILFAGFCSGLYFESRLLWIMTCYVLAYFFVEMLLVFTNAYLPEITDLDSVGQVSNKAWGLGYMGGLIVLIIFALFLMPMPGSPNTAIGMTPLFPDNYGAMAGPISAFWYLLFMIPFFLVMPDTKPKGDVGNASSQAMKSLGASFKTAWSDRKLFWFFALSLFSRDALAGIFIFGSLYASSVLGWGLFFIVIYGIVLNITGIFGGLIGAWLVKRRDTAYVVKISLWIFIVISFVALSTNKTTTMFIPVPEGSAIPHIAFFICGMFIGAGAGALQGSLRGLVGPLTNGKIPTAEAFGLYGMIGRATAFIAPFLVGVATKITQNAQYGAWPILGLFVVALIVYYRFERIEG